MVTGSQKLLLLPKPEQVCTETKPWAPRESSTDLENKWAHGRRCGGLPKHHLGAHHTGVKEQAEREGHTRVCAHTNTRWGWMCGYAEYAAECFDFFDHGIMAPRQIPCYSAIIHLVKKDKKQQRRWPKFSPLNQNNVKQWKPREVMERRKKKKRLQTEMRRRREMR